MENKFRLDIDQIEDEKKYYQNLPRFYEFGSPIEKETILRKNMIRVFNEVESIGD